MTFAEYVNQIDRILEEHPDWANLPVQTIEKWEDDPVVFPKKGRLF